MSKLKCVEHNRRVFVWDDGQGPLTVHRSDGTRCTSSPLLTIGDRLYSPDVVAEWGTVICPRCRGDHLWCQQVSKDEYY